MLILLPQSGAPQELRSTPHNITFESLHCQLPATVSTPGAPRCPANPRYSRVAWLGARLRRPAPCSSSEWLRPRSRPTRVADGRQNASWSHTSLGLRNLSFLPGVKGDSESQCVVQKSHRPQQLGGHVRQKDSRRPVGTQGRRGPVA